MKRKNNNAKIQTLVQLSAGEMAEESPHSPACDHVP